MRLNCACVGTQQPAIIQLCMCVFVRVLAYVTGFLATLCYSVSFKQICIEFIVSRIVPHCSVRLIHRALIWLSRYVRDTHTLNGTWIILCNGFIWRSIKTNDHFWQWHWQIVEVTQKDGYGVRAHSRASLFLATEINCDQIAFVIVDLIQLFHMMKLPKKKMKRIEEHPVAAWLQNDIGQNQLNFFQTKSLLPL